MKIEETWFIQAELVSLDGCDVSTNEQPARGGANRHFLRLSPSTNERRATEDDRNGPLPREEGTPNKVVRTLT